MKKSLFLLLFLLVFGHGEDAFERNCVECHRTLPATLQEMFKRYLLVYSGERNVKAGIKHYLLYPNKDISVMSDLFISTYGIKQPTRLDERELDEAIDIYWEKFKVFDKLK